MINEILEYAEQINKILKSMHFDLLIEAVINIFVIMILFKMVNIFEKRTKEKLIERHKESPLIQFLPILTRTLKFVIVFLIIAAFLQSNGYSVASLITGFGITGLAVGFAANATIANIFGTFAILSDRVYRIGDYIKIGANIYNITMAHKRLIDETFGITYDTSNEKIQKAREILEEIAEKHSDIYNDYYVVIDKLAESSINLRLIAYVKTNNLTKFRKVKEQILYEAIKRFRAEGIEFAFPSRSLYIAKQ